MSPAKKVKSVKAYRITNNILINGEGDSERSLAYFYEFDDRGNRIKEISYDEGEAEQEVTRTFDNGNLMHETVLFITDQVSEEISHVYNSDGLICESVREYSDGSKERTTFEYEGKLLVKRVLYDDDGEVEQEDTFTYENGKVKDHTQMEYGALKKKAVRTYDDKGREIEELRTDEEGNELRVVFEPKDGDKMPDAKVMNTEGKVVEAIVYKYDDQGRLLQEMIESSAKGFKRLDTRYAYDEKGYLVKEETLDRNGLLRKRILREYDDDGILLSEQIHEENPEYGTLVNLTTEFEYEYF